MKNIIINYHLQVVLLALLNFFTTQETQAQCSGVSESDSLELVAFYHATGGDNWDINSGWLVKPVKRWYGITLTSDGCHVEKIYFWNRNLAGELTDLQLPYLTSLSLSKNEINGSIPDFTNLPNLTTLNLDRNNFTGMITDFSNLPNLESLNLNGNRFLNNITDFSNLPNLINLDLGSNNFSYNSIPDFSNLPNLESLSIDASFLVGSIPDFSNLPKLTTLFLWGNKLSGSIPNFSNLPNLESMNVAENHLTGLPDFNNLPNLGVLQLNNNNLSGSIPNFSNLPNLEKLYLYENNLSGSIPDFNQLPNLISLSLRNNSLSGTIPDFNHLLKLESISLGNNNLTGSVPDFNQLPNLTSLSLYENSLSGTIPDFNHLPSLEGISLSNNDLSGSIPDFSNLPNLERLYLNENNLSGSIPNFSNLPNLEKLYLYENDLSGSIPDFNQLPNLERLYLYNNNLSGSIPDFNQLPNLKLLYLEYNNLSGAIPNFSNLPSLKELTVCPNNLQGTIPNFIFCPLLVIEDTDFSCVESAQVSGYVFYDENANCVKDENEKGIPNVFVYTDDEQTITRTDENGFYVLRTDIGSYIFGSSWTSRTWSQSCPASSSPHTATFTTYSDSIGNMNYAYNPSVECPQLKVEIGSAGLTRCFNNTYTINYCNEGSLPAENAYIELYFPEELVPLSSSIPYVQADDHLIFDIGDIGILECGSFTVLDSVSCEAVLGRTACVDAYAFPNDPCTISPIWSGANLEVKGECLGNEVQFIIKNTGSNMTLEKPYFLYENDVLAANSTFQLESGDSIIISREASNITFRLTLQQPLGNPAGTIVTEAIEGCGAGPFTGGLVNSQWDGDDNPFVDYDCQEIVGSYDPNDKTVFPSGVLAGNHISRFVDLTYRIRFQNTGNAVAYKVVIIDTIDIEHLQLSSLELGAYSHNFELDVIDGNILQFTFDDILLPDSTNNEPASHGFITYTLAQKEGNAIGDLITNEAAIYFDYNEPVITNKVFNTVGIPDTTTADFVHTSVPEIHIIKDDLEATVNYANEQLSIQINQVQAGEQFSLQLFNIMGQEVGLIPNLSVPLHQEIVPPIPKGVYIYRIQSSKGRVVKGKVMIND